MAPAAMRDCPHCGNEAPIGALRCKECFGDLQASSEPTRHSGTIAGVLIMLLFFSAVIGWLYQSKFSQSQLGNVTVDEGEERIVLVYTSHADKPTTKQLRFSELSSIEMEADQNLGGGNYWEVYAITTNGERVLLNRSNTKTLQDYANTIAGRTNKSLTIINNIRTGKGTFGTGRAPQGS